MVHLSVNLNKIALLRNSRGRDFPSLEEFGHQALFNGAHGLTLHPRPDQRHARFSDLPLLKNLLEESKIKCSNAELNVEGYPSPDFLEHVVRVRPDQCTLVPDPPEALTSDAGWDFFSHEDFLKKVTQKLQSQNIRVSLFLDPFSFDDDQRSSLLGIHPDRIELYTEKYAHSFGRPEQDQVTKTYQLVAQSIQEMGIDVNAGHDLNQQNLKTFIENIPLLKEVSIGHALIVEALREGFETTIQNYLKILQSQ